MLILVFGVCMLILVYGMRADAAESIYSGLNYLCLYGVLMQLNVVCMYVCMLILVYGVLMQLNRLAAKYTSDSYDVLNCNCNHFTEDLCMAICGVQVFCSFCNPFFLSFCDRALVFASVRA